ncbi:MAG: helix-turn-helix domain-containing protein [Planctomycetota bacterium]
MTEHWVDVDEVAKHLRVVRDTVYRWIDAPEKELPAHRIGRRWRFKLDEVDAWVKSGKADDREK